MPLRRRSAPPIRPGSIVPYDGLGHTRWATHGSVTELNAHPLTGCDESKLAIVLNGIVENYRELRESLIADGHTFTSETDAEVVVHLLDRHAPDAGRHHRPSARERLDRADRRALVGRRQDQRVERCVVGGDLLLVAEEEAVADDAQLVRAALDGVAIRAVADHAEHGVDAALAEGAHGEEHVVGALDAGHPSDQLTDESVGRDPKRAARVRPRAVAVTPDSLVQLDAEPDDRERPWRDAE